MMARTMKLTTVLAGLFLLSGCSIVGTWKTVRVEPEEYASRFMFTKVTFDDDGMYAGTMKYGDKQGTVVGKYKWNGRTLKIMPRESDPREYKGELRWGTKLYLHHEYEGQQMTGVMEKQTE